MYLTQTASYLQILLCLSSCMENTQRLLQQQPLHISVGWAEGLFTQSQEQENNHSKQLHSLKCKLT